MPNKPRELANERSGMDRRTFLRGAMVAGVSVTFHRLALAATPTFAAREAMPVAGNWKGSPSTAARRIDGFAKVTGAKLYASDFRAADMPGWPPETGHAMLLRTSDATHIFEGIDLSRLDAELQPDRVVLAGDLAAAKIKVPDFYAGDLLVPAGSTPLYLGVPVALLIWNDFARFVVAKQHLQFADDIIRMGAETGPVVQDPYGANRFVRVAGATPDAPDVFSPVLEGWITPRRYQKATQPVWAPAAKIGAVDSQASYYGDQIRKELDAAGADLLVLDRDFETQSIDQVYLEPEAGLAWYDPDRKTLEVVLGVQSPFDSAAAVAELVSETSANQAVNALVAQCAYIGGGFGGRDHSIMPLYIALAGLFSPSRPVRLANDRFEQFQSGIKRHAYKIRSRLGIDRATRKMVAFAADHDLDGGGLANFSVTVADVGATAAIGIYNVPKVDVTTVAQHSRGVTAGSMRGFGTLQTMTALEVVVDEAAQLLRVDPIEFRKTNALLTGQRNMTGNPPAGDMRTIEVLDRLAAHPLWTGRAAEKTRREAAMPGKAYGIGVACVNKDYGSGADAFRTLVELTPEGRIVVTSDAIEMGTGIATALAVRAADRLGNAADEVRVGVLDAWDPLGLVTSGNPWGITQADQDAAAKNPRWVPAISTPSSASVLAHAATEGVAEAGNVLFTLGLWPAARAIWEAGPFGGASAGEFLRPEDARFVNGNLTANGMQPLPLAKLAAKAHELGLVTSAMVHGFNRWAWAAASFTLPNGPYRGPIDALAVKYGTGADAARRALMTEGGYQRLDRTAVQFPPALYENFGVNYYSACGTLVAIEIDKATGALKIVDAVTVLECGRPLVPELVRGQAEGGFAMGVGQALSEYLPLYEDGPGNGTWNLNRYRLPRASDLPVWSLNVEILPPLGPTDVPKGIGEVVMIPVIPALLNAINNAVGHRFTSLPVTGDAIKAVLR